MRTYKIHFQFDSSIPIDYTQFKETFEEARLAFNKISNQRKKGRSISKLDFNRNDFVVTLDSQDILNKPSKALAKFSRLLIDTGLFNEHVSGRHLLRSTEIEDISTLNTLSDAALLSTLAGWLLSDEVNVSNEVVSRRRELIEEIKSLILTSDMILK